MTNQQNEPHRSVMERAIQNDRQKLVLIKSEAEQIVSEATPHDNPAASQAESSIAEANIALGHYDIALQNPDDQKIVLGCFSRAYPHRAKAEKFLAEARATLIDPIYPRKDEHP